MNKRRGRPLGPMEKEGSRPWYARSLRAKDIERLMYVASNPDLYRYQITEHLGITSATLSNLTCSEVGRVFLRNANLNYKEHFSRYRIGWGTNQPDLLENGTESTRTYCCGSCNTLGASRRTARRRSVIQRPGFQRLWTGLSSGSGTARYLTGHSMNRPGCYLPNIIAMSDDHNLKVQITESRRLESIDRGRLTTLKLNAKKYCISRNAKTVSTPFRLHIRLTIETPAQ